MRGWHTILPQLHLWSVLTCRYALSGLLSGPLSSGSQFYWAQRKTEKQHHTSQTGYVKAEGQSLELAIFAAHPYKKHGATSFNLDTFVHITCTNVPYTVRRLNNKLCFD